MADVIRVKAKKSYEWSQDRKFVSVQIPIPAHISLKKMEIYLSDVILRVTTLEKKQTHFIDLWGEIDYESHENKFVVETGLLRATLKKKLEGEEGKEWPCLVWEDGSLADLKARRKESEARFEKAVSERKEKRDKQRVEFDRKATQVVMDFEQK